MIFESCYWKEDLIALSKKLTNHYSKLKSDCDDKFLADFEKDIFISAYMIRKLMDAGKISDKLSNSKIPIRIYKAKKTVTKFNWHKLNENYESKYTKSIKYLRTFCNTVIHSYCFIPGFDKNNSLSVLYFNSAEQKDIEIYSVTLKDLSVLFEQIGYDYPTEATCHYNDKIKDYVFHSKTQNPSLAILYPYKKKIDNGEISINEVSKLFSIAPSIIKEIFSTINKSSIKEIQKNIVSDLSYLIKSGMLTREHIRNEYDIDIKEIDNYLNIISKNADNE